MARTLRASAVVALAALSLLAPTGVSAQWCGFCSDWTKGAPMLSFQGTFDPVAGNSLAVNAALTQGRMRVAMQPDGNVVLYDYNNAAVWSTGTFGASGRGFYYIMQPGKFNVASTNAESLNASMNPPALFSSMLAFLSRCIVLMHLSSILSIILSSS
jgi:hypothetical protein